MIIEEIVIDNVATYNQPSKITPDKKINLIYGLNGAGKSTLSNFLYDTTDTKYKNCKITPSQTFPILVFNQKFIQENFFLKDNLQGIFSLSKENKEIEQKILLIQKSYDATISALDKKRKELEILSSKFNLQKIKSYEETWKIKTEYSGPDRPFDYCLDRLKNQKENLFNYLITISNPENSPEYTINDLKSNIEFIKENKDTRINPINKLYFESHNIEQSNIFNKSIIGSSSTELSYLIDSLGNSDWVKEGINYIKCEEGSEKSSCPFCQALTIDSNFIENLNIYFDEKYKQHIEELNFKKQQYKISVEKVSDIRHILQNGFAKERSEIIKSKHDFLLQKLDDNIKTIDAKIKNPKNILSLEDTSVFFDEINNEIEEINTAINEYNKKLQDPYKELNSIKLKFWSLMRWNYNQTITRYESDHNDFLKEKENLLNDIKKLDKEEENIRNTIHSLQQQTINTDAAVKSINSNLENFGINGFSIEKHGDTSYRIVRNGENNNAFHSLSEGEKMMICFLYFCELCKGKSNAYDNNVKKIVVIDDPISSLSHIFIFNIGQLIKSVFFKNEEFSQVFVLTHSLYFFYELTDTNHDRRKQQQKLYRINKSLSGSYIGEMKYEEVQNDYQAYWSIINDSTQPPALIANCMRNIIEYFFNFVRKKDLNNVFQMPNLDNPKFSSFCRYINRESHSLGQNIIDLKEFNYDNFKEGLKLIFENTGYGEHYNEMSKI